MNNVCREIREWLSPYADGELDAHRQAAVTEHLTQCPACQAEWAARQRVAALLTTWHVADVPSSATVRLAEALNTRRTHPASGWLPRFAWGGAAAILAVAIITLTIRPVERAEQYTLRSSSSSVQPAAPVAEYMRNSEDALSTIDTYKPKMKFDNALTDHTVRIDHTLDDTLLDELRETGDDTARLIVGVDLKDKGFALNDREEHSSETRLLAELSETGGQ